MSEIKLITIQHKNVLKTLKENKVFYADLNRTANNLRFPYQKMMSAYRWNHCPIFAGIVGRYSEFYGAKTNDSVLIELTVPDYEVKIQKYYDWTDLIYFLEVPSEWNGNLSFEDFQEKTFHQKDFKKEDILQATINRIEPKWLSEYKEFSGKFFLEHFGVGGRNILQDITEY